MPYNLMKNNCEHFVRLAHGLKKESTQIQQYSIAALGIGVVLKSNNAFIQSVAGAATIASLLTPSEKSPFKNIAIFVGIVALLT
jgi:hypothetical protein